MKKLSGSHVAVSDRLITLRAELSGGRSVVFVCAYTPTLNSSEEDNFSVYRHLKEVLSWVSASDRPIPFGDFNDRVDQDCETWDGVIGKFGRGKMNENGMLLAMKCAEYDLAIATTFFRLRKSGTARGTVAASSFKTCPSAELHHYQKEMCE